jgi:hypothetical protein
MEDSGNRHQAFARPSSAQADPVIRSYYEAPFIAQEISFMMTAKTSTAERPPYSLNSWDLDQVAEIGLVIETGD